MDRNRLLRLIKVFIIVDVILFVLVFLPKVFTNFNSDLGQNNAGNDPLEDLVHGKIGIAVPEEMKYLQNYSALATVSASLNDSILLENIDSNRINDTEEIKVSNKMKLTLLDPTGENFSIRDLTNSEQIVIARSNTVWRWNVKPVRGGNNPLMLTASVIVTDKDGKSEKNIKVMEKTITVETPFMNSAVEFSKNNWEFLVSSILIPLIVFWYRERNKPKPKKSY